uniref:Secreted protein n=1 Tax=Steinernema glaseri TaxID=37863 RepID=A0A1I7YPV1_9BILA
MKKLVFLLIVSLASVLCGPPGIQTDNEGPPVDVRQGPPPVPVEVGQGDRPSLGASRGRGQNVESACGITRCTHGGRVRFPQPFNCAKYLESGHHGQDVLLEKKCPGQRQFNPMSCQCEEGFDCESCSGAKLMGKAGDRHYRIHLDMEKPHQIRCPEGEHFCEQSRHCVSDEF